MRRDRLEADGDGKFALTTFQGGHQRYLFSVNGPDAAKAALKLLGYRGEEIQDAFWTATCGWDWNVEKLP